MRVLPLLLCLAAVASATTYWVAKTGDDDSLGTEAKPWLTINYAGTEVVAGDSVLVKTGTYAELVDLGTADGTAAAPIVVTAYDGWSVIVSGSVSVSKKHYVFEDFTISYVAGSGGYGFCGVQG